MLHSGIDLHKRTVVLATVDSTGQCVKEAELPTTRAAVAGYFAAQPGPHRAVVESTATWYWLRDLLGPLEHATGFYIFRIESSKVKSFEEAKGEIYNDLKQEGLKKWLDEARSRSTVKIENQSALEKNATAHSN